MKRKKVKPKKTKKPKRTKKTKKVKKKKTPKKTKVEKLSKKDLKDYRSLLLNLRDQIKGQIKRKKGGFMDKTSDDITGDMADMATDASDVEFQLSLVSNEQDVLKEIEHALLKIEDKTYGICETYNTPISKKRLQAMPYVRNSLQAQKEIEKR